VDIRYFCCTSIFSKNYLFYCFFSKRAAKIILIFILQTFSKKNSKNFLFIILGFLKNSSLKTQELSLLNFLNEKVCKDTTDFETTKLFFKNIFGLFYRFQSPEIH